MAETVVRLDIPADFPGIDENAYASGAPASSHLGTRMAQQNRWLMARAGLRSWALAFPLDQDDFSQPVLEYASGTVLGAYPHIGTPQVQEGEFYVRLTVPAGKKVWVEPFSTLRPARLYDPSTSVCITGDGTETTYGGYSVPLRAGYQEVGLALFPEPDLTTAEEGTVWLGQGAEITAATGHPFEALSKPYLRAVRTYRDVDGTKVWMSEWCDIIGVSQYQAFFDSDFTVKDRATTYPDLFRGLDVNVTDGVSFTLCDVPEVSVFSVMFREKPLTSLRGV